MAETRGGVIAFMMTRTLYALQTVLDIAALGIALTGFTDISRLFDTCCQVKRPEWLTELVVATVLKNLKERFGFLFCLSARTGCVGTVTFENMGQGFFDGLFIFVADSTANRVGIAAGHAADLLQEGNGLLLEYKPAKSICQQVVNLFGGVLAAFMAKELVPVGCTTRANSSRYNAEILDTVDIVFF